MLAISPPRSCNGHNTEEVVGGCPNPMTSHHFSDDFIGGTLFEDFNIDDLLFGFDDVETDEILAGLSVGGAEQLVAEAKGLEKVLPEVEKREEMSDLLENDGLRFAPTPSSSLLGVGRGQKPLAAKAKDSARKRKMKVEWTPELHRRFAQAVEQLGIDKAVPSSIVDLMGVNCLTRHNITSHLQRFAAPLVKGVPPLPSYRPDSGIPSWSMQPQLEAHPSKESIDAAIRDVLAKPWLPLPLGLKPPFVDNVLMELNRQGISKITPSSY